MQKPIGPYIITVYQKDNYLTDVIIFKKVGVFENAYIDTNSIESTAIFTDNNGNKLSASFIESAFNYTDENEFCYGYPRTINNLKEEYPDCNSNFDLIEKYNEFTDNIFHIGYYDQNSDSFFISSGELTDIAKIAHSGKTLFEEYGVTFDDQSRVWVQFTVSDLNTIESMIKEGKTKEVIKKIYELKTKCQTDTLFDELFNDDELTEIFIDQFNSPKNVDTQTDEDKDIKIVPIKREIPRNTQTLEEVINELNSMVGLEDIKNEIKKLLYYTTFINKVKGKVDLEKPKLSMFFSGNPGTGKTTVAKIVAKIMNKMGLIEKDTILEITAKDLIAEYVGQTAPKTAKLISENKGGVILIDEAYVLANRAQEFAGEALAEILKELEKNETMFIFAGYKDEMENFMNLNPGLTSRISYYMQFKDYSLDELYQIFENKMNACGLLLADDIKDNVIANIKAAMNEKHFGNGRYIDKLIEKIINEHAKNTKDATSEEELLIITKDDVVNELSEQLVYQRTKKNFGF